MSIFPKKDEEPNESEENREEEDEDDDGDDDKEGEEKDSEESDQEEEEESADEFPSFNEEERERKGKKNIADISSETVFPDIDFDNQLPPVKVDKEEKEMFKEALTPDSAEEGEKIITPKERIQSQPYKISKEDIDRITQNILTNEGLKKTITRQQFDEFYKHTKPVYDMIARDPYSLRTFKRRFKSSNKPPLIAVSHFLFDNPIGDINNIKVLVRIRGETGNLGSRTVDREVSIEEAFAETRDMADGTDKIPFHDEVVYNYDVISKKLLETHDVMANIMYMLELYLKDQNQTVMDIQIPEESIVRAVLRLTNVVERTVRDTMFKLSQSVKFSVTDVNTVMESKYDELSSIVTQAFTAVLEKVKQDIDSTNVEDTKRALLRVMNPARLNREGIRAAQRGIYSVFLMDYIEQLIDNNFKDINKIEPRLFSYEDLVKVLNLKAFGNIQRDIQPLLDNRILKMVAKGKYMLNIKGD